MMFARSTSHVAALAAAARFYFSVDFVSDVTKKFCSGGGIGGVMGLKLSRRLQIKSQSYHNEGGTMVTNDGQYQLNKSTNQWVQKELNAGSGGAGGSNKKGGGFGGWFVHHIVDILLTIVVLGSALALIFVFVPNPLSPRAVDWNSMIDLDAERGATEHVQVHEMVEGTYGHGKTVDTSARAVLIFRDRDGNLNMTYAEGNSDNDAIVDWSYTGGEADSIMRKDREFWNHMHTSTGAGWDANGDGTIDPYEGMVDPDGASGNGWMPEDGSNSGGRFTGGGFKNHLHNMLTHSLNNHDGADDTNEMGGAGSTGVEIYGGDGSIGTVYSDAAYAAAA